MPHQDYSHYELAGVAIDQAEHVLVWGHGWGQTGASFQALSSSIPGCAHILLDFPGFGKSPVPPLHWGTEDYADNTAELIKKLSPQKKVIWVGHSFGARVGIQLTAKYPELFQGMCLIAGAGLPRKRSLIEHIKLKSRIKFFKIAKWLSIRFPLPIFDKFKGRFGSPDYQNAGEIRVIFVRTVNENLTDIASKVTCKTLLIYGSEDKETPVEIGKRLNVLIPNSELIVLPGKDHYSVLNEGRHIVVKHLIRFIGQL